MIGQTLAPIEGNPEAVRALSRTLRAAATKLTSMNAVLVGIKAGASWDSPSGELFEAAVRQSPPILDSLIDRYAGAAGALMTFSDELDPAQTRANAAISRHEGSTREYFRLEDVLASVMGTPEQAVVEERQKHALQAMHSAQDDHTAAWKSFTAADQHLARQLRHLAHDILDDSAFYSVLAKMDEFSQELTYIPPVTRRFPLVSALATAGDLAGGVSGVSLLLLYGEGSWKQVGINVAASGTVMGAKGLKTGSLAASRPMSRLADGKRVYAGEQLSTKDRFFIGTREELHKKYPKLGSAVDPRVPESRMVIPLAKLESMLPTKGMPLGQKAKIWRAQAKSVSQRQVDKVFLDNWRAASAGGANAQKMFVAGSTLERAVPKLKVGATNALVEKPEEKVTAPTYP
ncbi:putative T7SS-secreted protein [Knoellia sp. CPCC 206453]|uniref:putative T7SS-secreted protein n=1 Tax=Knoellia pratensis TaxID=3404796 RepID=UPI00361B6526